MDHLRNENRGEEDRGESFEDVLRKLSSFSRVKKELAIEYLEKMLEQEVPIKKLSHKEFSTISSLGELVIKYPNIDFAGFISRDSDKEKYQLWKLIDAFEKASEILGRKKFQKLKITLIVFGNKITYVSNGTIAINYERFSEKDLAEQLVKMARQQGS